MKKYLSIGVICISIFACKNAANEEAKMKEEQRKSDSILNASKMAEQAKQINTTNLKFAQETDPVCEMSIKDGVADTATVKGKLYGFCSSECKDSYVKEQTAKK